MMLIEDDATLRLYVPNVVRTVEGDSSLFDRLLPYLVTAQRWLESEILPAEVINMLIERAQSATDVLYDLPRRLVALMAWRNAVPSLDLIITANGLAAVETKTTKPASKAKVERLLESLDRQIDDVLLVLLRNLLKVREVHVTLLAQCLRSTLFSTPDSVAMIVRSYGRGLSGNVWERYKVLMRRVEQIEDGIANAWISERVLMVLRGVELVQLLPDGVASCNHRVFGEPVLRVIRLVKDAVCRRLDVALSGTPGMLPEGGGEYPAAEYPELERAVSIIYGHPDVFPEFVGTEQHRALSQRGFVNRKESTAYFL